MNGKGENIDNLCRPHLRNWKEEERNGVMDER